MKKLLFVLALIAVMGLNAFAQKSIDEMDGYDWVTMGEDQHSYIIQGYFLSCVTILNMMYEKSEGSMPQDKLSEFMTELERQFLYDESVGLMVSKLDDYYASPDARKYPVYRTIPYLAGKEWWNRKTGKVESSLSI